MTSRLNDFQLSPRTTKLIDWSHIRQQAVGFRNLGAVTEGHAGQPTATKEQVRSVFDDAEAQFAKAIAATDRLTSFLITGLGVGVIVIAAGILIVAAYNYVLGGTALSVAGVISLVGLIHELLKVGRDQAFLKFFLSGYEIAFAMAKTDDQYGKVLEQFLADIGRRGSSAGAAPKQS